MRYLDTRMCETDKPEPKINEMMILSIETITGLVEVLSNLLFPNGLNTSDVFSSNSSEPEEVSFVIPFSISKLICRILVILLEKSSRDISIQSLLNSMQVYINMSGMKKMRKERDIFLKELCLF